MELRFQTVTRQAGFILAISILLGGCSGGSGSTPGSTPVTPALAPWSLHAATDSELTAYFRNAFGPSSTNYLNTVLVVGFSAAAPAPLFSGTTLQETGVDEADLIKSDGVHVFSLDQASATGFTRETLRRQQLNGSTPDAPLIPTDSLAIPFSANVSGTGLYLVSERQQLIAVGGESLSWGIYETWFAPPSQYWGAGATEVALIDTSSPTQMQTRRTLRMTAQMIGSRRIGATLYLVLRSYPQVTGIDPSWPAENTASNQAIVNSLQASQLLPTLSIDGGAEQPLVQSSSCFTQEQNSVNSADIITVVGIDLASATHSHAAICFTGGTEAFYMSDQSLYLATSRYAYTYSGWSPVYQADTSTDIHKFALNGTSIAYRGSGNVTGHLGFDQNRKSFRMGEYAGALRVLTETQPSWGGWIATPLVATTGSTAAATTDSPGHLTVLQENAGTLQTIGKLPNAARPQPLGKPGEQLYASRFLGARGYLVTYRITDPLYVLDLSDPADPKIAGELQVDGYSDYLFPLNDNLLLGVGKDAIPDGSTGDGRAAWYQGVKVSLIDVSDPAHPQESARQIIGLRGTDATVLRDHHGIALQYLGNNVRVNLPVSLHDTPSQWSTGAPNDYFDFTRTELQRFDINLTAKSLAAKPSIASTVAGERDITNDRSLLWNDQTHWYQNGIWTSAAW